MRKFWQKKYVSKYTGKEIDDAVAKAGTALQNPMTAAGDLIVGGEDGAAEKLVKGADGKVLKMVSGAPAWADDAGGMANPMTTAGDIIVGGADGAAGRLGKGTDGQVLSMVSGSPAWAAAGGGGAEHLYWHSLTITAAGSTYRICAQAAVLNQSSESIDLTALDALIKGGAAININATAHLTSGGALFDGFFTKIILTGAASWRFIFYQYESGTYSYIENHVDFSSPSTTIIISDTVNQIF